MPRSVALRVVFAALERGGRGADITSQVLREVRTYWIMTNSAIDVVTVDVGESEPIGAQVFHGRQLGREGREQTDSVLDAIAVRRGARARDLAAMATGPVVGAAASPGAGRGMRIEVIRRSALPATVGFLSGR